MRKSWKPEEAPGVRDGLILFDGVCVFCSGWVQFMIKHDRERRFMFTPIQSPYGRKLAAQLGIDDQNPQSNAVIRDGRAHFKSDSVMAALGGLPAWRWVRAATVLPRPVRDWLYDRIAKNRYRWFGRAESCMVPSPELMSRFVFDDPA